MSERSNQPSFPIPSLSSNSIAPGNTQKFKSSPRTPSPPSNNHPSSLEYEHSTISTPSSEPNAARNSTVHQSLFANVEPGPTMRSTSPLPIIPCLESRVIARCSTEDVLQSADNTARISQYPKEIDIDTPTCPVDNGADLMLSNGHTQAFLQLSSNWHTIPRAWPRSRPSLPPCDSPVSRSSTATVVPWLDKQDYELPWHAVATVSMDGVSVENADDEGGELDDESMEVHAPSSSDSDEQSRRY